MNLPEERFKSIIAFIIVSGVIFLNSCDAPRENPLDPNSSDNLLGTIEGTVQTFSLPYTPIKNVEVYWQAGNKLVYSDTVGNFTIPDVKMENGPLIFRKAGYHIDTVQIDWAGSRKVTEQINLNKIPMLDSLSIYSVITNTSGSPSVISELIIQTKVIDVDNDIDTVYVVNYQLGLDKAMDFNVGTKTFQSVLTPEELNITDLEQVIGFEFDFSVRDVLGEIYLLNGGTVKRIIKDQVTGLQPSNNQIITALPLILKWKRFTPGYSFNYMIEIYTNDGSQLVLRQDNIASQDTTYSVDSLSTGNYWWAIWVIDNYNDMGRSLPAAFSLQ